MRDLAGDAALSAATGDQQSPAIARGSNGYLVAWSDRRASLFTSGGSESLLDIFAMRLDDAGQRVDSTPIALSQAAGDETRPTVVWNGQNWLVAWVSQAPFGSIYSGSIVGVRVAPSGQVLDSSPVAILGFQFSNIGSFAAASDGQQWFVIAQGTSGGSAGLYGARLSAQGTALDPTPAQLLPEGQLNSFQLAYAQGAFLVTWSQYSSSFGDDIVARRFDSALHWIDPAPFVVGRTAMDDTGAQLASNGAQFLVAWGRYSSSTYTSDVKAVRVAPSGTVLDATPIDVTSLYYFGSGPASAPAWDGTHWYVGFSVVSPMLARITSTGTVVDFDGFAFDPTPAGSVSVPVLAGRPTGGAQAVWVDDRAGSYEGLDLYGAHVLDAANVAPEHLISNGAPAQLGADVATDGVNHAVGYRSETSGARRILVSRLDPDGVALDPEPIEIASGLLESNPSIAWDGSVYLIVWDSGSSTVLARRMSASGALLDAAPIAIGTGTTPEAAGMNGEFLIAYTRAVAYPLQQFPNVVRLRGIDAAILSGPLVINSNYAIEPDVCVLGNRWLVVWQRNYWNNDTHCDVAASFVDASGTPTAPFWVAGTFNWYNHSVAVAASNGEALITWVYGTASNLTRRVHARRIAPDASFLDAGPIALINVVAEQFAPSVAWDGTQYVVAFQDARNTTSMLDKRSDVYGARVTSGGSVLDLQGFLIERSAAPEVGPALAALGGGRALIASSIFRPQAPFAAYRIGTRTLDGTCPPPAVYCTAKTTSLGTLPSIGTVGTTSIGANNLRLTLASGVPNANAIHFYGYGPAAVPFFQGTRCATLPFVRSPILSLSASGSAQVALPLTPALLGETRYHQWWMRDGAHPDGTGVGLSDAVSLTFCP